MKYNPFVEFYGLNFKDSIPVDQGLKYTAIENGSFVCYGGLCNRRFKPKGRA